MLRDQIFRELRRVASELRRREAWRRGVEAGTTRLGQFSQRLRKRNRKKKGLRKFSHGSINRGGKVTSILLIKLC